MLMLMLVLNLLLLAHSTYKIKLQVWFYWSLSISWVSQRNLSISLIISKKIFADNQDDLVSPAPTLCFRSIFPKSNFIQPFLPPYLPSVWWVVVQTSKFLLQYNSFGMFSGVYTFIFNVLWIILGHPIILPSKKTKSHTLKGIKHCSGLNKIIRKLLNVFSRDMLKPVQIIVRPTRD